MSLCCRSLTGTFHSSGRGAVFDVESDDVDSQSTGTSDASTPVLERRHRRGSVGSDESGSSGGVNAGLFKVCHHEMCCFVFRDCLFRQFLLKLCSVCKFGSDVVFQAGLRKRMLLSAYDLTPLRRGLPDNAAEPTSLVKLVCEAFRDSGHQLQIECEVKCLCECYIYLP